MIGTYCLFIRKVGRLFHLIRRCPDGSEIVKSEHPDRVTAIRALHEYYRRHVIRPEIMERDRYVDVSENVK